MRTLIFSNAEAIPKRAIIICDTASVKSIMEWYGGFHAGDRYIVTLDGKRVPKDQNGLPKKGLT